MQQDYYIGPSQRDRLAGTLRRVARAVARTTSRSLTPSTHKKPRDLLVMARRRIARYSNWSSGTFAERESGSLGVPVLHKDACRWCAIGAVLWAARKPQGGYEYDRGEQVLTFAKPLMRFNDGMDNPTDRHAAERTKARHRAVLAIFDAAIAGCKTQETD